MKIPIISRDVGMASAVLPSSCIMDIPKKIKEDIKITPVSLVDDVLKIALTKELKRVEWTEVDNISKTKNEDKSQASIQ